MRRSRTSIYETMYSILLMVIVVFFSSNMFSGVPYNVLSIEETYYIGNTALHIHDIFPLYDAPTLNDAGLTPYMDIQSYIYRLSTKLISFALIVGMYRLTTALNIFLSEIPGRRFNRLPRILLVICFLFGFEIVDFVFNASSTAWQIKAGLTFFFLSCVCLLKKGNRNA